MKYSFSGTWETRGALADALRSKLNLLEEIDIFEKKIRKGIEQCSVAGKLIAEAGADTSPAGIEILKARSQGYSEASKELGILYARLHDNEVLLKETEQAIRVAEGILWAEEETLHRITQVLGGAADLTCTLAAALRGYVKRDMQWCNHSHCTKPAIVAYNDGDDEEAGYHAYCSEHMYADENSYDFDYYGDLTAVNNSKEIALLCRIAFYESLAGSGIPKTQEELTTFMEANPVYFRRDLSEWEKEEIAKEEQKAKKTELPDSCRY
jgi:hypothetical protein